jgi:MFS transporter, MHS family, shikimate and dehydroshikimate transport protein
MSTTTKAPAGHGSVRLVAFASLIGTTIEWYDFFLYGTAAALVFNRLFFPNTGDELIGTLYAFGTYAVGFFARPVGGIVIGHYGDRVGRKSMLVLTLLIMGVATALIGLLPTYEQIGPWAAVLLVILRLAQGFGVGGEWGGAVLMAVEHAPPGRRGFYGSWPQIGVPAGLVLSTFVFALFRALPEEQFFAWGWRVPFLLSALLVVVGLIIRVRILETPSFAKVKDASAEARQPILEVLSTYPKQVLLAMGARFAENGAFYIYSVFVLVYATQQVKMNQQAVLYAMLFGAACELVAIPVYGALSDRIGRRPVYLFGAIATAVLAYPLFMLLDTGAPAYVALAMFLVFIFSHAPMYGPQGAFLSELFGTRVRYSGASLGAQLSSVLAGGLSPFIATYLLRSYGRNSLALYLIFMAAVTIVAVLIASETHQDEID